MGPVGVGGVVASLGAVLRCAAAALLGRVTELLLALPGFINAQLALEVESVDKRPLPGRPLPGRPLPGRSLSAACSTIISQADTWTHDSYEQTV